MLVCRSRCLSKTLAPGVNTSKATFDVSLIFTNWNRLYIFIVSEATIINIFKICTYFRSLSRTTGPTVDLLGLVPALIST